MTFTQQNDRSPDTTHLYVWLGRDADGQEGIVAAPTRLGVTPLVFTSRQTADSARELASRAAALRGFPVRLVEFGRGEQIDQVG